MRCSTASTARPRPDTRRSPARRTCARPRGPRAARCPESRSGCWPLGPAWPRSPGAIWVSSHDSLAGAWPGRPDAPVFRAPVRTGDIGWFDADGRLFVGGRADDMIVTGGENVYPVEVENALEQHPAVLEAAVTGVQDEEYGQVLAAHLVLRHGQVLEPEDLPVLVPAAAGPVSDAAPVPDPRPAPAQRVGQGGKERVAGTSLKEQPAPGVGKELLVAFGAPAALAHQQPALAHQQPRWPTSSWQSSGELVAHPMSAASPGSARRAATSARSAPPDR